MSEAAHAQLRRFPAGLFFAGVWLIYLVETGDKLLDDDPGLARDSGLVALTVFVLLYIWSTAKTWRFRNRQVGGPTRRDLWALRCTLAGLLLLGLAMIPGAGQFALRSFVFVAALAMIGLPLVEAVTAAVVLFATAVTLNLTLGGRVDDGVAWAVGLASIAVLGMRLIADRNARLFEAQQQNARLAVSQERARIATDLHDILGHSLTVVAVKAELAQRLLDVDLERARAELRDLEILTRDALSDVRSTALGVRGVSLAGELAAARQALAAANVTSEVPNATDGVPSRCRELFAWTIREAVTNVVRHSGARTCQIRLTATSVEILDDGCGADGAGTGSGLSGLRRRAESAGASLETGNRADHPGFRVRVEVPA
jgi:two-component system sensor histidine kinase DesK